MSTRESFLISPIKSIQRGSVTATNNSTGTVTVTAVDTTKSVLTINVKNGYTAYNTWGDSCPTTGSMTLTNSTTLTWVGGIGIAYDSGVGSVIEWQLVEYK